MNMINPENKPVIGFSCGDVNGIGVEIIIKALSDNRLLEICTPVIFASNKVINFYKKAINDGNFNYQSAKELQRLNNKMVNVYNCWQLLQKKLRRFVLPAYFFSKGMLHRGHVLFVCASQFFLSTYAFFQVKKSKL